MMTGAGSRARAQAYQRLDLPTDRTGVPRQDHRRIRPGGARRRERACAVTASPPSTMAGSNSRNATPCRSRRELRELRATHQASLPRVRIEDLLQDVDEWCGFTRAFQPLGGYQPRGGIRTGRCSPR